MSASFDDVMDEMKRDRAKEKPAVLVERDRTIAHAQSIAEPYFKDLGPKVVCKLKELGVPPEELAGPTASGETVRWWSFKGNTSNDSTLPTGICLLENGVFVPFHPYTSYSDAELVIPGQIRVALRRLGEMRMLVRDGDISSLDSESYRLRREHPEWIIPDEFDGARVFVDPESELVYVVPGGSSFYYSSAPKPPPGYRFDHRNGFNTKSAFDPIPELGTYLANYIRYIMLRYR